MTKNCLISIITAMLLAMCFAVGCERGVVRLEAPAEPEPQVSHHSSLTNATQHTAFEIGEAAEPCIAPDGKTIVFASNHHGQTFDLFARTLGESTVMQITTDGGDDRQPAIAPNGKIMAFVSNRKGNWDIFIREMRPDSPEIQLTNSRSDDVHPSWSPDGKRLVYSTYNTRKGCWNLWIIDFNSTSFQRRSLEVEGLFAEWCPKAGSETILFQRPRGRSPHLYTLWTVRSDGTKLIEVLASARWAVVSPTWNHDGEWVVFSSALPKNSGKKDAGNLWVIRGDGKFLTKIGEGYKPQWDAVCAPDGRVFFVMPGERSKNIWSIKPDFDSLPAKNAPAAKPDDDETSDAPPGAREA